MRREMLVAAAFAAPMCAGFSALAQSPSPYGSIEFRWRERAAGLLATSGGVASVQFTPGASAIPSAQQNSTANPTNGSDARFVFVLEARVTRAAGNTDLGGLGGFAFGLSSTDTRTAGNFAGIVTSDASFRNAASAGTSVYNAIGAYTPLPAGALTLPDTNDLGDRGVFGPFRSIADIGSKNTQAIGVRNLATSGPLASLATLQNIVLASGRDPLTFTDPVDGNGPFFGRNDFYGLDNWVPLFTMAYNVLDVNDARNIYITPTIAGRTNENDSGIRGFRGINDPALGVDSWQIDTTGIPTLQIANVPTPGAVALLGLGGLVAARRRRS